MATALRQLFADFLSALVFLAVYAWTGQLVLATLVAVAVAIAQLVSALLRKASISVMQWVGLGLVIVLSSLTLITHDSRFVQLKPSIAHFAIGGVMLKRGWQTPYMPARVREWLAERVLIAWGYAWAVLMILMGLANIAAVRWLSLRGWGIFITGLLVAKLVFFAVQYLSIRAIARSRRAPLARLDPPTTSAPQQ